MTYIVVLNDGTTWSDLGGCTIQTLTESDSMAYDDGDVNDADEFPDADTHPVYRLDNPDDLRRLAALLEA